MTEEKKPRTISITAIIIFIIIMLILRSNTLKQWNCERDHKAKTGHDIREKIEDGSYTHTYSCEKGYLIEQTTMRAPEPLRMLEPLGTLEYLPPYDGTQERGDEIDRILAKNKATLENNKKILEEK